MISDEAIEKELQAKGLNAPRLTPADIDAVIVGESYTILPSGKCMVCELTLRNGFTVLGESACVSKENFDEEIGRKISRETARDKIWGFEAYLLQERLHRYKIIEEQLAGCEDLFTEEDEALVEKTIHAIAQAENGEPLKDFMDDEDIFNALKLLSVLSTGLDDRLLATLGKPGTN